MIRKLLVAFLLLAGDSEAATLTTTVMSRTGWDLTAKATAAAGGGDKWLNTGAEHFVAVNASGGDITITFAWGVGGAIDGQVPTARTYKVLAGHTAVVGPFPTQFFNDANGYLGVTYSGVTTLTVAVIVPGS